MITHFTSRIRWDWLIEVTLASVCVILFYPLYSLVGASDVVFPVVVSVVGSEK